MHCESVAISGGDYRVDGGAIFGIVPRPLWQRTFPADEHNRILQATNCLLLTIRNQNVLIDTGYGNGWPARFQQHHALNPGLAILDSLAAQGLSASDIDHVVCSHLHFDHAGGLCAPQATESTSASDLTPSARGLAPSLFSPLFPLAQYHVQRLEWEHATSDAPEFRGAYDPQRLLPVDASGQLVLHEGDAEVLPGLTLHVTGGHTPGHQAIRIQHGERGLWYLGDICATRSHLAINWCMAYDLELLQTRRVKLRLLEEIARQGDRIVFDHDPVTPMVRIERTGVNTYQASGAL